MEIVNLHSWLLKMPAMNKFNIHSSERKSGKIIVNFACVYHYWSYLGLPFLLNQTWALQFCHNLFLKQPVKYCASWSRTCLVPCLLPYSPLVQGSWDAFLFYFIFWFSHPIVWIKIVFVTTEQLTLCRTVSLGQNHVTSLAQAQGGGVSLDNILSVVCFVILI